MASATSLLDAAGHATCVPSKIVILSFDFSVMRTGVLAHKEAVRRGRAPNAWISNGNINVWQVKVDFVDCKVVECLAEFVEDNKDAVVGFVVNGK
eukprot:536161-Rhodomonas_salina.1